MKKYLFQGLEQALDNGCYIKLFCCSMGYPVVRVEKVENEKVNLIAYYEGCNLICALNGASSLIIDEVSNVTQTPIICDNILLDKVIQPGYTLHFFKLTNGKILSAICGSHFCDNYIPIKSVISDDITNGIEMLEASLKNFNLNKFDFFKFAHSQTEPVEKYIDEKLNEKKEN